MRTLVTGGAGFIGSFVVDALVAEGHEVVVIDSLDPAAHSERPEYLNSAATYLWQDVRDQRSWVDAFQRMGTPDVVLHQAGKVGLGVSYADVVDYVDHNDAGWAAGLRALHDINFSGRIVLASSMVVYGEGRYRCQRDGVVIPAPRLVAQLEAGNFEPPCPQCGRALAEEAIPESAPCEPRNVYAATKLHQEHLLSAFIREHTASGVALRYHNVYGPRMPRDTPYAGVASLFRSALAAGRPPLVTEDGRQRRNFVHVSDVAAANVRAALADSAGFVACNVAASESQTVGEMACALASAFGAAPGDALWPRVTGGFRVGDVRHVFASTERAASVLGYRSQVDFLAGMNEFAGASLRAPVVQAVPTPTGLELSTD